VSDRRAAFAEAAESLVGTPFRFRGRDPHSGLDCIGLVITALQRIGSGSPPVPPYAMRQRDFAPMLTAATAAGFESVHDVVRPGDLLLLRAGPAQPHLAIADRGGGVIHAHAGLGRVVITPPPCPSPIERHWRLRED
jgi:cell wall-associated NlpC family hydrolase